MKTFIQKYKWTILYWIVFLSIVLYFAPRQSDYYLDTDIKTFKSEYLNPVLIGIWVTICSLFFIILVAKTKSFKQSMASFFYVPFAAGLFLFLCQNLFLAGILFLNRQIKRDSLSKTYVVSYLYGAEKDKGNFHLFDLSTRNIISDRKLINKLYHPRLKNKDTLVLNFDKGLFGIEYLKEPFSDK